MKKTLNEEVSRIKGMMGINEAKRHSYTEGFGDNRDGGTLDIDWEDPRDEDLAAAQKGGYDSIEVYGSTFESENEVGTTHYKGMAPIVYDFVELYADLENVSNIEIDTDWEPSDDQMMNQGNHEGGISHGGGDSWQGR